MVSTKLSFQSILLLCVILFSMMALHHCDESKRTKAKLASDVCIPLFNHGEPPEWCCYVDKPPTCDYDSLQACLAKCHQ
ncbi:hypothetical protein P3S67_015032 [Capsicum chacoense]